MKKLFIFFLGILFIGSCSSETNEPECITALDCAFGQVCEDGVCVEDIIGDSGDTGDTGNTGNSGDSGNTGDSGDSGNTGDSGDTGDTVDDSDDSDDSQSDKSEQSDMSDESPSDDSEQSDDSDNPFCGNGTVGPTEDCDRSGENVEPGYTDLKTCNTNCEWNSYCGDGVLDNKAAAFNEDEVILRFEGDSQTQAVDDSPKAINRTVEGAQRVEDGKYGKAIKFTGTCVYNTEDFWICDDNQRVFWSFDPEVKDNFTVMAWIKAVDVHEVDDESTEGTDGTRGQRYLFPAANKGDDAGIGISVGTNGVSVYEHGTGYMPAILVYETGLGTGWNHIAVSVLGRRPFLYINGKLAKTGSISSKNAVFPPVAIGSGDYGNFRGTVDEVRIVGRSLSETHIKLAMGEVCDAGTENKGVEYGLSECNTDCMINSHCGDGILDTNEVCDKGADNGKPGGCRTDCSGLECNPGSWTFAYTGAAQTFTAENAGTYTIEVWGAQGGPGNAGGLAEGAMGGYAKGDIELIKGDTLNIFVGQGNVFSTGEVLGAFNGGGAAHGNGVDNYRGAGGGASDVRLGGAELSDRIIVAGGGGGSSGAVYLGGAGGGETGETGNGALEGAGGTQFAGGNGYYSYNGSLGLGGSCTDSYYVAGGGGGYYGGGAGLSAGGGSGYIGGVTNASMQSGIRGGNGEVKITLSCP